MLRHVYLIWGCDNGGTFLSEVFAYKIDAEAALRHYAEHDKETRYWMQEREVCRFDWGN